MQQRKQTTAPSKSERYREIVATLARHGIGVVGGRLVRGQDEQQRIGAEHLREACEELGTTFIKLGQALSTRSDLLPESYREQLAGLQDNVPPVDFNEIEGVIVEELGASPELLFESFDRDPIACASIGQAYAARLREGRDVVVKVQKPGVADLVGVDLEILAGLAQSWSQRFPVLQEYDAQRLVDEFSDSLRNELDYTKEAANVRAFGEFFRDDPGIAIPEIVPEFCTPRVVTLTRMTGVKPSDAASLPVRRRRVIAQRICRFILEPAFEHGQFHADPHPGNFLIRQDGSLAVLDFGMVARLTPDMRRRVADLFTGIDRRDSQRVTDRLIEMTAPAYPVDRAVFTAQIERLLEQYVDASLENMKFGEAIAALMDLVREHRLRMPGSLAQLFKALVMCEGLLESIEPDASLSEYLEPMVSKLMYRRLSGGDLGERIRDSALDAAELTVELPRRLDRVLGEVERGNLRVWARIEDIDTVVTRFEHIVERANATMLAAACIVALAIMMLFYHPQGWERWIGVVFWVVFAAAGVHVIRTLLALRK